MITIGMPSWNNKIEVWFTLSALRMYQDLTDTELLLVDNAGNAEIKKICNLTGTRYILYTDREGPQAAKDKVFEQAKGDFVLCIDSHILLWPDAIANLKSWLESNWDDAQNLIQAPMIQTDMRKAQTHLKYVWRGGMWGIWGGAVDIKDIPQEPFEIDNMGTGLMGCRKDSWLGLNQHAEGFGGAEGYIQEKYRKHGRKVISLPFLMWMHNFFKETTAYRLTEDDKIRNYASGFEELGLDLQPLLNHFGEARTWKLLDKRT